MCKKKFKNFEITFFDALDICIKDFMFLMKIQIAKYFINVQITE